MKTNREMIRQQAAAGNADARFANHILSQREQGVTRQRTVAEIAPCQHGVWCPDTRCQECRSGA